MRYFKLLMLLVFSALFLYGCVEAKISRFVRYVTETDTFEFLTIYQDIRTSELKENEGFWQFYVNRDSMIIPAPTFTVLFGGEHWMRMDDVTALNYSLNGPGEDSHRFKGVSLMDIKISAGTLKLDAAGSLCYAHRTRIPGVMLDGVINQMLDEIYAKKSDSDNLDHFRDASKATSWAAFETSGRFGDFFGDTAPFSAETRSMIANDLEKGKPQFHRKGTVFYLPIPMTAADADGVLAWLKKARASKDTARWAPGLGAYKTDTGIVATFDLVKLYRASVKNEPMTAHLTPANADDGTLKNASLLSFLREKGVLVPKGFNAQAELRQFNAENRKPITKKIKREKRK